MYNQILNDIVTLVFNGTFPNAYAEQCAVWIATIASFLAILIPVIVLILIISLLIKRCLR